MLTVSRQPEMGWFLNGESNQKHGSCSWDCPLSPAMFGGLWIGNSATHGGVLRGLRYLGLRLGKKMCTHMTSTNQEWLVVHLPLGKMME